jgi:nucleoporin GLE1
MGWKRKSEGKYEDPAVYTDRMCGYVTYWGCFVTISMGKNFSGAHPVPVSHAWQMLARLANTPAPSLTDTHYAVVSAFIDAGGLKFLQAYGRQGHRLLMLLTGPWIQQGKEARMPNAVRLDILGGDWKSQGKLLSVL